MNYEKLLVVFRRDPRDPHELPRSQEAFVEVSASVFLEGLAIQNYQGIGPEIQRLGPFRSFNFFIGANNAGKSTVLNFLATRLPKRRMVQGTASAPALQPLEQHNQGQSGPIYAAIGISEKRFFEAAKTRLQTMHFLEPRLQQVASFLGQPSKMISLGTQIPDRSELALEIAEEAALKNSLTREIWRDLWNALTRQTGGGLDQNWFPETMRVISAAQPISFPQVSLIPAIRQIGPKGSAFADFSGAGLIDRLAAIQNPEHDRRQELELFDKINHFLQTVTGRANSRIEIPFSREHVLVHIDGRVLPLASLGTGIHEVIMIAAFCTLSKDQIVCIEEPEIHLHPILQRRLIAYLQSQTTNQYFVATHSAAFIDTPGSAIFHVRNDGIQTRIKESILRRDRFAICVDLGHRASDIIQSNAIIWVEGPSDRIYIRHWIKHVAPELIEGIHYSTMFYGGRLLSHLSAADAEVSEFIELRSLNRNVAILMDSDKGSSQDEVNETKARIVREFSVGSGVAWITLGREIENYIPFTILQNAVKAVYKDAYLAPANSGGQYQHALHFKRSTPSRGKRALTKGDVDKVKVARLVCKEPADLSILDLETRVREIVQMIRDANKA